MPSHVRVLSVFLSNVISLKSAGNWKEISHKLMGNQAIGEGRERLLEIKVELNDLLRPGRKRTPSRAHMNTLN